uniref:Calx-beta domain-containing protein n=1 Tax=Vogesella mureinivorans TaxID=657276 RepID=UPI00198082E0
TDEADETVKLSIGGKDATGTILDNDSTPTIESIGNDVGTGDVSATEGDSLAFTVKLSNASSTATSFDFALQDGTATADDYSAASFSNGVSYDAATGKITVPAGVTSFTVTVPTSNDTTDEADETVKLSIGGKDATGTIIDNDGTPTIESIGNNLGTGDVSATEGSDLAFTVKLSNASSSATSFDFALQDGTATADDYGTATFSNGVSYDPATGKITVPAGVTSFTVTVPTSNDTTDEADETVKLSIGGKDATGTIIDNDETPTIEHIGKPDPSAANPNDVSATEGDSLAFTVKLSNASSTSTSFDFALQDGTATSDDYSAASFSNGVSYDAATGKITVPAGVTSFTVTVPTSNDTTDEADETIKLSIGGKDATGTILDNDGTPTIESIGNDLGTGDVSATEGDSLAFTVKLSNASSSATTFDFALQDGTATSDDYGTATFSNGVSYDAATGKITVPAGVTSFTVTVPTSNDTTDEADETVKLSIGGKDATGTIIDNDETPTIEHIGKPDPSAANPNDVSATEGDSLAFTVKLSNASSTSTTFDFALQDGTATADDYGSATFSNGVSYDAATGKITVPAGVTSFTVTVPTSNDTTDEADETVK